MEGAEWKRVVTYGSTEMPISARASSGEEVEASRRISPLRADRWGRGVRRVAWLTLALGLIAIWTIVSW